MKFCTNTPPTTCHQQFVRCLKSRHYLVPFSSIFGVIGVTALDGESSVKCELEQQSSRYTLAGVLKYLLMDGVPGQVK